MNSAQSMVDVVARSYVLMDARDKRALLLIIADPFVFDATTHGGDQIAVSPTDAADMLIVMQHDGADLVRTSIDELLVGTGCVGVVGHTNRVFNNRAMPVVRAFTHLWQFESRKLASVDVPAFTVLG